MAYNQTPKGMTGIEDGADDWVTQIWQTATDKHKVNTGIMDWEKRKSIER